MIDVAIWRLHVFSERGPARSLTRYILAFLSFNARDGAVEYLTTRDIALHTRLSHHAVLDHLKYALDAGWLSREQHQRNTMHWRRFDYFLRYPIGFHGKQAGAADAPKKKGRKPKAS